MLSENTEDRIGTIFGFCLCVVSLLVILISYFRSGLGRLSGLEPLEDGMIYCHQHQKRASVLVKFQNKLIQCKLLVYILGILSRVVIWNGDC